MTTLFFIFARKRPQGKASDLFGAAAAARMSECGWLCPHTTHSYTQRSSSHLSSRATHTHHDQLSTAAHEQERLAVYFQVQVQALLWLESPIAARGVARGVAPGARFHSCSTRQQQAQCLHSQQQHLVQQHSSTIHTASANTTPIQ